jgi:hypothetical protein
MGNKKMKWQEDLVLDIRTNNKTKDNADYPWNAHPKNYDGRIEFTDCNRDSLLEYFMKIRDTCSAILEIGVCRNGLESSTHVFLNNKLEDTYYVGIDLDNKSYLNNEEKRIHTIQSNSSNVEDNIKICQNLGIEYFDFIFIDGWHSINQVLTDWEYTKWLSPKGIVGFHDVSIHPGPHAFIASLNRFNWHVVPNTCPNDWGIGFAWKK